MFEEPYFKEKYHLFWCWQCDCIAITCPVCKNCSCNAGSCGECHATFVEFHKLKSQVEAYLTEAEKKVWAKGLRLKHLIIQGLSKGMKGADFSPDSLSYHDLTVHGFKENQ